MILTLLSLSLKIGALPSARGDEPSASYLFPAGGQRGTTVQFHVGGHYLHDACRFQLEGPGVSAVSRLQRCAETVWFEGPVIPLTDSQQKEDYPVDHAGSVTIAADATPGLRRWRVSTSQGVTASLPFVVGDLPEVIEREIDGAALPVPVQLPVTVNGRIFPREDMDIWTFTAKAGEAFSCEVLAAGLESPLDAVLKLIGPDGTVLRQCDDHFGPDPRIAFVAPVTGMYQLQLQDANLGGLQHYVYRLSILPGVTADGMYPLGGTRGTVLPVELFHGAESLGRVEVPVSADSPERFPVPGQRQLWGAASSLPEVLEAETGDAPDAAETAGVGQILNGRIGHPGDRDVWQLQLAEKQTVILDLFAARLGSPLDSVLTVLDAEGQQVAEADDMERGGTDSQLRFTAPRSGEWRICIADRFAERGGPQYAYRLVVQAAETFPEGFTLALASDACNLPRGGEAKVKVTARRTPGFQGEIGLSVEGLPTGVTVEGVQIPVGKNETTLILKAAKDAPVNLVPLTIRGEEIRSQPEQQAALISAVARLNRSRPDDQPGEVVWMSVCVPTPFKFVGAFETKYAPRGSTFVRRYRIERGEYSGPLTVSLAERQTRHLQGVTGPVVQVPAGVDEFEYPVRLPPWMEIGRTSRTCLMAVGQVTTEDGETHPVSYTSFEQNDQVIVLVDPGRMSLRLERDSLLAVPGSSVTVPVQVFQEASAASDVRLELILPRHVEGVRCAPVILPAGSSSGVLTVEFSETQPGPFNMPLTVRATSGAGARLNYTEESLTVLTP
jgi:hypothetical protein